MILIKIFASTEIDLPLILIYSDYVTQLTMKSHTRYMHTRLSIEFQTPKFNTRRRGDAYMRQ